MWSSAQIRSVLEPKYVVLPKAYVAVVSYVLRAVLGDCQQQMAWSLYQCYPSCAASALVFVSLAHTEDLLRCEPRLPPLPYFFIAETASTNPLSLIIALQVSFMGLHRRSTSAVTPALPTTRLPSMEVRKHATASSVVTRRIRLRHTTRLSSRRANQ